MPGAAQSRCMSFFSSFLLLRSSSRTVKAASKGSSAPEGIEPQPPSVRSFFKELLPHIPWSYAKHFEEPVPTY